MVLLPSQTGRLPCGSGIASLAPQQNPSAMADQPSQESSPVEISVADLPQSLGDLVLKADAAIEQNNLGYAVKILLSVLKAEPGFVEGRKKLRAAEMKIAGPPKKKRLFAAVSYTHHRAHETREARGSRRVV